MIITIALFDIQSYWPCLWRLPGLFIIGKAVCVSLNVPSISGGQSCRSWGLEKLRSWLRALAVHSYVKHGRLSNKFTEISILIWEVQPLILFVVISKRSGPLTFKLATGIVTSSGMLTRLAYLPTRVHMLLCLSKSGSHYFLIIYKPIHMWNSKMS